MRDKQGGYFDLKALLAIGFLNLRHVASIEAITVSEYTNTLEKLLALTPDLERALDKIANHFRDKHDFEVLNTTARLLKDLKCEKLADNFDELFYAREKGNQPYINSYAKIILDRITKLHAQIEAAKTNEPTDSTLAETDNAFLRDAIKRMEQEDKTRKMVILAVDDSPVILKSVSFILSDEYKVFTLANPTMLEKMLSQITPELFLLDCHMPDLTGFDLIPIIRSHAEHKETPVIFLTSEGSIENVSGAVMLGASDFVVKPVHPETLRAKIAYHIVRK
ncbi:MAG: response regulator [Peptococcaceae bacterium]|nr:response regulator [Peptococcaceae bacterium]